MKIWISGSLEEVIEASNTGLIDAIVTNPTVISKWSESGKTLEELASYVIEKTGLPIYIQLRGPEVDDYRRECYYLKKVSEKIIPKIPSTQEGISAAALLESEGVETLVTTVCSLNQAYCCAVARVTTICPYFNRVIENNQDADELLSSIHKMFRQNQISTKIVPASIRSAEDVSKALTNGCNGVIIFTSVFKELFKQEVTKNSLEEFKKDWEKINYNPS